ncbi:SatD family protein [Nocardioides sp. R-C-SC26]|uniref:SatD family protein n=1 Tax=Nocardioides sp. R-C-SC26 TaxID=2870414 RepID=UPI001E429FF4|nr:SatD family protein [Nocardioides sp. R-C-SC26]
MDIVLIGDVVASRDVADRPGLHRRLEAALGEVDATTTCRVAITVGDEYQGHASSLGAAIAAATRMRLALLPDVDVRHGIGIGATEVLDAATGVEDGPGWWAARAAIEAAERDAARPATRAVRTTVACAATATAGAGASAAVGAAADPALTAALLALDDLIGRMDPRSLSVLRGLMDGMTQVELAVAEQVSASAISQRIRQDSIGTARQMIEWLSGIGADR